MKTSPVVGVINGHSTGQTAKKLQTPAEIRVPTMFSHYLNNEE